jgi:hypothetical protein
MSDELVRYGNMLRVRLLNAGVPPEQMTDVVNSIIRYPRLAGVVASLELAELEFAELTVDNSEEQAYNIDRATDAQQSRSVKMETSAMAKRLHDIAEYRFRHVFREMGDSVVEMGDGPANNMRVMVSIVEDVDVKFAVQIEMGGTWTKMFDVETPAHMWENGCYFVVNGLRDHQA